MTGIDIYKAALHILADTNEESDRRDYEERYPYILALFYGENEELDTRYRSSNGLPIEICDYAISEIPHMEFQLSDVFFSAAVYYLAAMLIIDENTEFSDKLFEKYAGRMTDICASLPLNNGHTKDVYNL